MKLIHSIGLSETKWDEVERLPNAHKGKLLRSVNAMRPKIKQNAAGANLENLVASDPDLLIRQYISVFDKILRKKDKIGEIPKDLYQMRDQLGEAVWPHILRRAPKADKALWRFKVHPYSKNQNPENERKDVGKSQKAKQMYYMFGRLRPVMWVQAADGNPNYDQIAENIDIHLFKERFLYKEGTHAKPGLVEHRLNSIIHSTAQQQFRLAPKIEDLTGLMQAYGKGSHGDVAAKICQAIRLKEDEYTKKNKDTEIFTSLAGKILYEHFGNLQVPTETASAEDRKIHDLHLRVKKFYSDKVRKSARGIYGNKAVRLSYRLPKNLQDLQHALERKQKNQDMTALIRNGRNLFHAIKAHENGHSLECTSSRLRTSAEQTKMKHTEAFERYWRTALSQARFTLSYWADPESRTKNHPKAKNSNDLLNNTLSQLACSECFAGLEHFNQQARLVFGNQLIGADGVRDGEDAVFTTDKLETAKSRLYGLIRLVAGLRNKIFHFSDQDQISKSLEDMAADKNFAEVLSFGKKRLRADRAGQKNRALKVLNGLGVQFYAPDQDDIKLYCRPFWNNGQMISSYQNSARL